MRLDLADLRLFMAIAETGSITGGAEQANLALASASERLRNIEQDIGVALFVRHSRGVSLTEVGQLLEQHARKIMYQHEFMKSELKSYIHQLQGDLLLYANTSATAQFLPKKLSGWLMMHPDVHLELKEKTSAEIIQSILAGTGEAGIVSDAVHPQSLILEPIADDHLAVLVGVDHPLATQEEVFLKDLVNEPFIGLYEGSALQEHIQFHVKKIGHELILRVRMNTFEGVCEMVEKGVGISILPKAIADQYQSRFQYKKLILKEQWAKRRLCLCYRNWEDLTPMMKNFLTYLKGD